MQKNAFSIKECLELNVDFEEDQQIQHMIHNMVIDFRGSYDLIRLKIVSDQGNTEFVPVWYIKLVG